jgi:hypothetical protein
VLLTSVETLLARGAADMDNLSSAQSKDDYHVVRGKNEELEKEMAKMTGELEVLRQESRRSDTSHAVSEAKIK